MSKKTETVATAPKFVYLVRTSVEPPVWVGSPTATRTPLESMAACWMEESGALSFAKGIRGSQVVAKELGADMLSQAMGLKAKPTPKVAAATSTLSLVPPPAIVAPAKARKPKADPKPVVVPETPKPAAKVVAPKTPKGPSREDVVAMLVAAGLPVTKKSSDHWGDKKGPRLVLPAAGTVTRVYLYKMESATTLLGYHSLEQRKAKGLGAVTHVCDVVALSQLMPLVAAVAEANGIVLRQDGKPRARRTRKPSPASGVTQTDEVVEAKAEDVGTSQTNEGAPS